MGSFPAILCIDDEEVVLTSLERFMEKNFSSICTIEMAQNGEDALEIAQELKDNGEELAVVVCDYIMPNMKGDEVLSQLFKLFPEAKNIMLTGQASIEGISSAINRANLYRFIQKPWDGNDLLLTIQEAFKSYMQNKEIRDHTEILEATVEERTKELKRAIVDLKSTQDKLIETEKMAALGKLVAGVAHEINTPVGVCVTASSTLKNRTAKLAQSITDDPEMKKNLEGISQVSELVLKNIQKANELIGSFKKVATDQSCVQLRDLELCSYLHEIAATLHPQYDKGGHELNIICSNVVIKTNPGPLAQIITNLVINSIVHGFKDKTKGSMTIEVKELESEVLILFSDNGCGIDKSLHKKVFEPFYTTNRGEGSGLGLHIVYNIITVQFKGSIELESSKGDGVRFNIRLPLQGRGENR